MSIVKLIRALCPLCVMFLAACSDSQKSDTPQSVSGLPDVAAPFELVDCGNPEDFQGIAKAVFDGRSALVFNADKKRQILNLRIPLPPAEKLEIAVDVYVPAGGSAESLSIEAASFAAAFWDKWMYGKNIPYPQPVGDCAKSGWRRITFAVNSSDFPEADGVAAPLQLVRLNIDFEKPGKGSIGIGKIFVRRAGVYAALETGNPRGISVVNLLDKSQKPRLVAGFLSEGAEDVELSYEVRDYKNALVGSGSKKFSIPSGKTETADLNYPEKCGIYDVKWTLKTKSGARSFSRTFAAMNSTGMSKRPLFADGFIFSVCDHLERYVLPVDKKMIDYTAEAGLRHFRGGSAWGDHISPKRGEFNVKKSDRVLAMLLENGIEREEMLTGRPSWASRAAKKMAPAEAQKYLEEVEGEWIEFFVGHIEGKVRMFENTNEINLQNICTPEDYARRQAFTYKHIKAANPDAMLLSGSWGGVTQSIPWQKKIYVLEPDTYDVVAMHHHGTFETDLVVMPTQMKVFKELGIKKWFSNETAWTSTDGTLLSKSLFRKLIYDWSLGSMGYTWYNLRCSGWDPKNGEHNFGLLFENLSPRAPYVTYNMICGVYGNAHFVSPLAAHPEVFAFRFEDGKNALAALWSMGKDAESRTLIFKTDAESAELIDMFGNVKKLDILGSGSVCVPVGAEPETLRLSPASASLAYVAPLARELKKAILIPGQRKLAFEITNPNATPETAEVSLSLPSGVKIVEAPKTLNIAGGGNAMYEATVDVPKNFQAGTDVKKLSLDISIGKAKAADVYLVQSTSIIPKWSGKKDEKRRGAEFRANRRDQVTALIDIKPENEKLYWSGPRDVSASATFFYPDENDFFISFVITDDVRCQPYSGADMYKGDSIQLMLLFPGQNAPWEIGVSRRDNGEGDVHIWGAPTGFDTAKIAAALKKALRIHDGKTYLAINIHLRPKDLGINLEELKNRGFRFNAMINDNDGSCREGYISFVTGDPKDSDNWISVGL